MTDLDAALSLLGWMREHKVKHARIGQVEIWLEEEEPSSPSLPDVDATPSPPRQYADPLDDPALWGGPPPSFLVEEEKK